MNNNLLELTPEILKQMSLSELEKLANDIRKFLIEKITITGGHLGPNLGVVELTIALHYVFSSPNDQFIFDIGHQAYTHKIITGRAKGFDNLRQKDGISGFTSYQESLHDVWEAGHAGTSLSALMGVLYSKNLLKDNTFSIGIIGDGALSSGMSLEALNLIGYHNLPGIIIINNNRMSISKSVGQISKILNDEFKVKKDFFNHLGYHFVEVEDGHDIKELIKCLKHAKTISKPQIILVNTVKGKGHLAAEEDQIGKYHMISSYNKASVITWSQAIAMLIEDIQDEIETVVVIPAMELGSHLTGFKEKFSNRFLDVGISEEHAASMAAAIAKNDIPVILSLYSTFSQRAYDQILNDIARPGLGVFITIDRAGLIAGDGDTHQGIYDVSMFNAMPNLTISAPRNIQDAADLLRFGLKTKSPFVMRFPKEEISSELSYVKRDINYGWDVLNQGNDLTIISYGPITERITKLVKKYKLSVEVVSAKFIKPMDYDLLNQIFASNHSILVIEEIVNIGGLYSEILRYKEMMGYNNIILDHNLNDLKIPHLTESEVKEFASFDDEAILSLIKYAIR